MSPLSTVALTLVSTVLLAAPASAQEADTSTATIGRENRAPLVTDDYGTSRDGAPVSLDVLANDADLDGDALALLGGTSAGHGVVDVDGSVVTYVPDEGYSGEDSFTYLVGDARGASSTGTVRISVTSAQRVVAAPPAVAPRVRPAAPVAAVLAAKPAPRTAAVAPPAQPVVKAAPAMGPSTRPYVAPAAPAAARPAALPFTGLHDRLLPTGLGLLLSGGLLVVAGRRRPA